MTWSSAYRNAGGEVMEGASDLQRFEAAEAEQREEAVAAPHLRPPAAPR